MNSKIISVLTSLSLGEFWMNLYGIGLLYEESEEKDEASVERIEFVIMLRQILRNRVTFCLLDRELCCWDIYCFYCKDFEGFNGLWISYWIRWVLV